MTTFYLIRHAEKDTDPQLLSGRTRGVHLSARGRRQAEGLARFLGRAEIEHVFSSPMERTQETAAPLAREKGLAVEISEKWDEFDCGSWTGRTFSELLVMPGWAEFNRFRSGTPIPQGESALAVQARVVGEMLRWRSEFPDAGVAVVSHGDPIKFAIAYFLGVPIDFFLRFEISLGSVSVMTLDTEGPVLVRLNAVPDETT